MDARQALQTREAAFATAWVIFQRNVRQLSVAAICALAGTEPIRKEDGGYDPDGGIGRPLAKTTVYKYLAEARDQFREEYIKRPILDMVMEEDERLEHLAAQWAQEARAYGAKIDQAQAQIDAGTPIMIPGAWLTARHNALTQHLRVLESRRKLLGLDQPTKVQVHDETGSVVEPEKAAALQAAMDALRAEQASV